MSLDSHKSVLFVDSEMLVGALMGTGEPVPILWRF
jgi:hypothetical protein